MTNQKGFMKPGWFAASCIVSTILWCAIFAGVQFLAGVMA